MAQTKNNFRRIKHLRTLLLSVVRDLLTVLKNKKTKKKPALELLF